MKFAILDLSGTIAATALEAYAAAQQRQLREHFAAMWDGDGATDEVRVAANTADVKPGEVAIRLEPQAPADQQGAIGFHDRLPDGTPIIHVFLDLAAKCGDAWTSVASHEVLETRADPRLHACVELDDGTVWDREVCDRVERDTYVLDGVTLSNFNGPDAFEPPAGWRAAIARFDWLGRSSKPNEVRPGGYAQRYDASAGWQMVGEMSAYRAALAALGMSRGARRVARRRAPWWRRLIFRLLGR